jgi:GNAT superfamily N-acetyltransferase
MIHEHKLAPYGSWKSSAGTSSLNTVIHEDYQELGLARKLFEILSNKALQEGVNIETGTLTRNKRALTFYKKLGFRPLSVSLLLDIRKRILEK